MYYKTERWRLSSFLAVLLLAATVSASLGDRLPAFKECVQVLLYPLHEHPKY